MGAKVKVLKGAYWVVTHHDGTRRHELIGRPLTRKNLARAERHAEKVNAKIALGDYEVRPRPRETFPCDEMLREWHRAYTPTMKRSYERSTLGAIRNHLEPYFGATDLRDIREADLLAFAREKSEAGLSPNTIRNFLAVLRRVYYLAQREGRVTHNPAARIGELMRRLGRRLASEDREIDAWTREEVAALLAVAREDDRPVEGEQERREIHPVLYFLFATGARKGEGLALRWEDVNVAARTVTIRRSLNRGEVGTPKSGRRRTVVMSDGLAGMLRNLLDARRKQALARGWSEVPPWVFCSREGTPLDEGNVSRSWYRVRRKAQAQGVRPLKLHCARHTWATLALQSGKPIKWAADQLGHSDPALTMRVYAHAQPEADHDLSFLDFEAVADRGNGTRRHQAGRGALPVMG